MTTSAITPNFCPFAKLRGREDFHYSGLSPMRKPAAARQLAQGPSLIVAFAISRQTRLGARFFAAATAQKICERDAIATGSLRDLDA